MTSSRPYLIRALHEWIVDNAMTPYVLVDCRCPEVRVPVEHVSEERIVLNVSPGATQGLVLDNERVSFSARFGGKAREVTFPVRAVLAIYARENGRGMVFNNDSSEDDPTPDPAEGGGGKPKLRVIK